MQQNTRKQQYKSTFNSLFIKSACVPLFPCVSLHWWVHFPRSVLFCFISRSSTYCHWFAAKQNNAPHMAVSLPSSLSSVPSKCDRNISTHHKMKVTINNQSEIRTTILVQSQNITDQWSLRYLMHGQTQNDRSLSRECLKNQYITEQWSLCDIYIQGQTQKSFRNLFDNWILSCWAATELSLMLNKICYLCRHICIFNATPAYDVWFVSWCAIEWCSRTDL